MSQALSRRRGAGGAVVLVVDDEPMVLAWTAKVLQDGGYHVHAAEGPGAALRELGSRVVDVLVTDVRMPEMNGVELASRVRATSPAVGIVFLSGWPGDLLDRFLGENPDAEYLAKPVPPAALLGAVSRVLGGDATAARLDRTVSDRGVR